MLIIKVIQVVLLFLLKIFITLLIFVISIEIWVVPILSVDALFKRGHFSDEVQARLTRNARKWLPLHTTILVSSVLICYLAIDVYGIKW